MTRYRQGLSVFTLCLLAILSSGCATKYYKYYPDELVHQTKIIVEHMDVQAEKFEISTRTETPQQIVLAYTIDREANLTESHIKSIDYIQSWAAFSDGDYKHRVAGAKKKKRLYLEQSQALTELLSPLHSAETSTTRNRRISGKPSLIWETTKRLESGGKVSVPEQGDAILCSLDMSALHSCITYRNGERLNRYQSNVLKRLAPGGELNERNITDTVVNIVKQDALFKRVLKNQRSVKAQVQPRAGNVPDGMTITVDDGVIEVATANKHLGFSKAHFFSQLPKKYHHLIDAWLKEITVPLSFSTNHSTASYPLRYFDGTELHQEISRLEKLGSGYIRLTANMDNVDVYIDGKPSGKISKATPYVGKLTEGRHTIQVRKDFFGAKTISVQIEADDAFAYDFDMQPSGNMSEQLGAGKVVQSTGVLVIVTTRNDIQLEINGISRTPPTKLPNMPSGKHKMKVITPEREFIIDILVKENAKSLIDLDKYLH